jgi:hypothetical protein
VKQGTLLHQCMMRAGAAIAREDVAAGRDPDAPPTRGETMRAIWRSTQDASKVCALIVIWAVAMMDQETDELGPEEFSRWSAESRATVYRRLQDFRRLWPEYDSPNELARMVVKASEGRRPTADVLIPQVAA